VTELIVRELRLRRFDGVALAVSPRSVAALAGVDHAVHRPPEVLGVERLTTRHSRRRAQPAGLGL
jgi:hypothetical protein